MKLKKYLKEFQGVVDRESSRVKKIGGTEAAELLQSKCKNSLNKYIKTGDHINRWTNTARQIPFGFLDASSIPTRLSRNTLNYYTLIINDDPLWKKFPRRQVIASLYKTQEVDFTNPNNFIVFPYDSTKIGICNNDDIWDSFPKLKSISPGCNARSFNVFIAKLLNVQAADLTYSSGKNYDKSLNEFKNRCKQFDKEIGVKDIKNISFIQREHPIYLKTLDEYKGDLYKYILNYYDTKGFKLGTGGSVPGKDYNEVWFEGPAVFINSTEVEMLIGR